MLDEFGLIGRGKSNITFTQRHFQRADLENELSLLETVRRVKPTVLLGLSGKGGLFTEEIIKEMHKYCPRPIIFPMSNPTHHSECTAQQAYEWTNGECIFASGSPFDPVTLDGIVEILSLLMHR
jgi:malic enzyme